MSSTRSSHGTPKENRGGSDGSNSRCLGVTSPFRSHSGHVSQCAGPGPQQAGGYGTRSPRGQELSAPDANVSSAEVEKARCRLLRPSPKRMLSGLTPKTQGLELGGKSTSPCRHTSEAHERLLAVLFNTPRDIETKNEGFLLGEADLGLSPPENGVYSVTPPWQG